MEPAIGHLGHRTKDDNFSVLRMIVIEECLAVCQPTCCHCAVRRVLFSDKCQRPNEMFMKNTRKWLNIFLQIYFFSTLVHRFLGEIQLNRDCRRLRRTFQCHLHLLWHSAGCCNNLLISIWFGDGGRSGGTGRNCCGRRRLPHQLLLAADCGNIDFWADSRTCAPVPTPVRLLNYCVSPSSVVCWHSASTREEIYGNLSQFSTNFRRVPDTLTNEKGRLMICISYLLDTDR